MQLPAAIGLSLVLIVVAEGSNSGGPGWRIHVRQEYREPPGSDVTVLCNFTYPEMYHTDDVRVYWKKPGKSVCSKDDLDKQAFVFHLNQTCVHDDYRGRAKVIGSPATGNCTLLIRNVTKSEPKIYLRVAAKNQNYSFYDKSVSIVVLGNAPVTSDPDAIHFTGLPLPTTQSTESRREGLVYAAAVVPAVAVVLIVAGILFARRRKCRSKSFTREESGRYANVSRASSDTTQRTLKDMKVEQTLAEPKAIDEPVYINLEAPQTEALQDTDQSNHIYGNVDYT